MKFRLLKQEDGRYTFRELLKSVCVLHDGLSLVCVLQAFQSLRLTWYRDISRDMAVHSITKNRHVKREVKLYCT